MKKSVYRPVIGKILLPFECFVLFQIVVTKLHLIRIEDIPLWIQKVDALCLSVIGLFLLLGAFERYNGNKYGSHCKKYIFSPKVEIHVGNDARENRFLYLDIVRSRVLRALEDGYSAVVVADSDSEICLLRDIPGSIEQSANLCTTITHLFDRSAYKCGHLNLRSRYRRVKRLKVDRGVSHFIIPTSDKAIEHLVGLEKTLYLYVKSR